MKIPFTDEQMKMYKEIRAIGDDQEKLVAILKKYNYTDEMIMKDLITLGESIAIGAKQMYTYTQEVEHGEDKESK